VPGIAEMEGAIGVRILDAPVDSAHGIKVDPGVHAQQSPRLTGFVKSDLLYEIGTLRPARQLEKELPRAGMFTLAHVDGEKVVVHRSLEGSLAYTPIKLDGGHVYVERSSPRWASVHERRFNNTRELITALSLVGMKYVG
jgi:hypothetical protein